MVGCRQKLIESLPVHTNDLTIREWTREDMDELTTWAYPFPYDCFKFSFSGMTCEEKDHEFARRQEKHDRVTLVADRNSQKVVAYLALVQIKWKLGIVGNMAYRVSPSWCDRGIGTQFMRAGADWLFGNGFDSLRLDVAATNPRAIRCYEKAGFVRTGEFWRDDWGIQKTDLNRPEYAFLQPHVRLEGPIPQIRFFWMEAVRPKDQ